MATSSNEEIVGEYRVIEDKQHKLGAGSYGTVYKAEHVSKKNNFAAAKKISVEKEFLGHEACQKEKDLLMNKIPPHENIIKVYDVVQKEYKDKGVPMVDIWLLMEYAPFGNLKELAQEHELTVEKKIELMLDCALGVQHLHNCKPEAIAHRDIKPENVVITGSVKNPAARLCDFGVGKAIGKNSDLSSVTMKTVIGTPKYAAPEQFVYDGDGNASYDKSVDIYSLGVTFDALLESSPGKSMVPRTLDEIQNRPSDTPLHKAVKDIIQNMVQLRPGDRISIGNVVGGLRVCKSLASWFTRPSSCDQGCQSEEPQTAASPASDTPFPIPSPGPFPSPSPGPPPCALAVPLAAPPEGTLDLVKRQLAEHRVPDRLMGVIESSLIGLYGTAHTSGIVTCTDETSKARMKTILQESGLTVENLPEQLFCPTAVAINPKLHQQVTKRADLQSLAKQYAVTLKPNAESVQCEGDWLNLRLFEADVHKLMAKGTKEQSSESDPDQRRSGNDSSSGERRQRRHEPVRRNLSRNRAMFGDNDEGDYVEIESTYQGTRSQPHASDSPAFCFRNRTVAFLGLLFNGWEPSIIKGYFEKKLENTRYSGGGVVKVSYNVDHRTLQSFGISDEKIPEKAFITLVEFNNHEAARTFFYNYEEIYDMMYKWKRSAGPSSRSRSGSASSGKSAGSTGAFSSAARMWGPTVALEDSPTPHPSDAPSLQPSGKRRLALDDEFEVSRAMHRTLPAAASFSGNPPESQRSRSGSSPSGEHQVPYDHGSHSEAWRQSPEFQQMSGHDSSDGQTSSDYDHEDPRPYSLLVWTDIPRERLQEQIQQLMSKHGISGTVLGVLSPVEPQHVGISDVTGPCALVTFADVTSWKRLREMLDTNRFSLEPDQMFDELSLRVSASHAQSDVERLAKECFVFIKKRGKDTYCEGNWLNMRLFDAKLNQPKTPIYSTILKPKP